MVGLLHYPRQRRNIHYGLRPKNIFCAMHALDARIQNIDSLADEAIVPNGIGTILGHSFGNVDEKHTPKIKQVSSFKVDLWGVGFNSTVTSPPLNGQEIGNQKHAPKVKQ